MDKENRSIEPVSNPAPSVSQTKAGGAAWLEVVKVAAIPLVTLILGFVFNASINSRQARETNYRLYTEMMGRREEADSAVRKDMFNSILGTFMNKDPKLSSDEQREQQVLNLELLAYNFHESLDLGPLFKHVRRRIEDQRGKSYVDMLNRIEKVAQEVIERQLTVFADSGMIEEGDALLEEKNDDLHAYIIFGPHTVSNPAVEPGKGVSRVCLSMPSSDGGRHHRQFKLELTRHDPVAREVEVRLFVSRVLSPEECQRADLDEKETQEIDPTFSIGLFDFPMIDNTHLTHGERCAVALTQITDQAAHVVLAYFPGSRASLKDKPYYDDLVHDLIQEQHMSGHSAR